MIKSVTITELSRQTFAKRLTSIVDVRMMFLLEYVWHHFRCLGKRLATQLWTIIRHIYVTAILRKIIIITCFARALQNPPHLLRVPRKKCTFYQLRSGMVMQQCGFIIFVRDKSFVGFGFLAWVIMVFGPYSTCFIRFHYFLNSINYIFNHFINYTNFR